MTLEPDRGTEFLTVQWRLGTVELATGKSRAPLASELIDTLRRNGTGPPEDHAVEEVGQDVFRVLAPGDTRRQVLAHLEETLAAGRGARIVVRCPSALARVPWELMWSWENGHLALVEGVSVVRHSSDARSLDLPDPAPRSLQILHVDGGITDEPAPARADSASGAGVGIPHPLMTRAPNHPEVNRWGDVRRELQATAPTAFHFTGPGVPAFGSREARLQFTGRDTGAIARDSLRDELIDAGVMLAVLATRYPGVNDHWDGIGADLVSGGVPAVVSIPGGLGAAAESVFVGELYRRLAAEASVDDAVACGRRAVHAAGPSPWWLPVLHSRATHGIRFGPPQPPAGAPRRPVLPRTRNAVPMHGDPPYLWIPAGLHAHDVPVLSANGRACAVAATDGTITVGIIGVADTVHWWPPVAAGHGTRVVAVHTYPYHAEVLVSSRHHTSLIQVDSRGSVPVEIRRWGHEAVSGAWVGPGFVWIDTTGSAQRDDARTSVPFGKGCRLVDAAVGGGQRLVSWVCENELGMCRTDLASSAEGEIRTTTLDVVPEDLVIARTPTQIPSTTLLAVAEDLLVWTWDALAPVREGNVSHGS